MNSPIPMPPAVNVPVYLSLQSDRFDRDLFEGLSDKLKAFIGESPEYRQLIDPKPKSNGYGAQKSGSAHYDERNPPPHTERELDDEIPF